MVSIKKTAYFFGLVLAVVLFSAFGCKSAEEQAAEDQKTATDPATSVTYDTSTGSTNTTPVIPGPATTDDQTGTGTEDQTQNSDAGTTEGDTT
ncbi:hypothetical protein KKC60_03380, partial [Patescibacteria group bacterium]|nr:hypothetical protein [Patescibacteria group bacterium]